MYKDNSYHVYIMTNITFTVIRLAQEYDEEPVFTISGGMGGGLPERWTLVT